jgi:hypothetical protein
MAGSRHGGLAGVLTRVEVEADVVDQETPGAFGDGSLKAVGATMVGDEAVPQQGI